MKYFHFDGRLDEEMINKFFVFMNENISDDLTIVLNSGGGKINLGSIILDIINKNKLRVTLISCGAYSAAFYIFYNAECKRKMTTESYGMMHRSSSEMRMQSNIKPSFTEDEIIVKNWKESSFDLDFAKLFMSKKELSDFKKGSDIYFTFKRMKEIFPDVEII